MEIQLNRRNGEGKYIKTADFSPKTFFEYTVIFYTPLSYPLRYLIAIHTFFVIFVKFSFFPVGLPQKWLRKKFPCLFMAPI